MNTVLAKPANRELYATPYYVLREDNQPIGPDVVCPDPNAECTVIYGFSDKIPYDNFCRTSDRALTPYPLVKGYLQNQADRSQIRLVVLDAAGAREPILYAATMESVLESQTNQRVELPATHMLVLDTAASAYRLETS